MHHVADGPLSDALLREAKRALSARIEGLRTDAGLSMRAAARGANMHHSEWLRIERGEIDPRLSTLLRMQQVLNVDSLEGLLGETPSQTLIERPSTQQSKRKSA
jgi:transcriptional regulator with XRE-family HTH domain